MKQKRRNTLVARLTLQKPNNQKLIVEVHEGADFHRFYQWFSKDGRKRKVALRTSNRNDGITLHWRAPFEPVGLEAVAARTVAWNKTITGVTIKIFKKRAYQRMTTCAPDELGPLPTMRTRGRDHLPRWSRGEGIPVRLPSNYLPLQKRMDILTGVTR
jgi:hypothetical protein